MSKASEFVNQGNKALTQAKVLQKDTRKYMCCALMMLLSICIVVVLAVVQPWKSAWSAAPRRPSHVVPDPGYAERKRVRRLPEEFVLPQIRHTIHTIKRGVPLCQYTRSDL